MYRKECIYRELSTSIIARYQLLHFQPQRIVLKVYGLGQHCILWSRSFGWQAEDESIGTGLEQIGIEYEFISSCIARDGGSDSAGTTML